MPGIDGLEMTVQMRKLRDTEELAIIGVSETAKAGVLARFLKSGASGYLKKPFCVEEFYCRVDQNIDMFCLIQQARGLASRDFLTRLYNRRSFFEIAQ